MKAVIYARYSSHNQTEQSIEGQLAVCYHYANQHDLQIVSEYIDRGISGTTDNRVMFQQMIADSAKRQFEIVLVYQLDRFSRDRYDSAVYKKSLKKNGVRVVSAMEPISDDASGILMEAVLEGFAEYFSAELSQKVRRGMEMSVKNGTVLGGITPLGYRVENKRYVIDEASAPVVRKIFEMYLSNYTMAQIIDYLNQNGIKTCCGNAFGKNSIRQILTNKRYIGSYVFGGVEYPNKMPAIIDKDVFEEVQILMQKNKKAPARSKGADENYILTTKLYCGNCKAAMTGMCGTSRQGTTYQYYVCVNARKRTGNCHKANVPKLLIENCIIRAVRELLTDANIAAIAEALVELDKKAQTSSNLPALNKRLAENKKAQKNLIKAIEQGQAVDTLTAQLAQRQQEQALIETEIVRENLKSGQFLTVPKVTEFLKAIRNGSKDDIAYRQSLVDVFVDRVYLYDTPDGKNRKVSILLNTQDGEKEIPIDDTECSSMGRLVTLYR